MIKRLFDIVSSSIGLLLLFPLFIILALLIKIFTPGKVFFLQKRVGLNGNLFQIIKFRTMVDNHGGNTITLRGETRITPLGAFLRKHKLDELPELWNILKGEMSIVGPRPDVQGYADKLQGADRLILTVKPGLTGLASLIFFNEEEILASRTNPITFNNEILWPEKVRINLIYIKNWSFCLDLKIVFYTIFKKAITAPWAQSDILTHNINSITSVKHIKPIL